MEDIGMGISIQIDQWIAEKTRETDEAVQESGINIEAGAKQRAAVDTGRFRSGYQYQNTGLCQCSVNNPTKYGPDLEFGTTKMAARPSLFPAVAAEAPKLEQKIIDIWNS